MLLTALFAQADAAHVGGDGDAARFWLALLWPGILVLGHQLDTCLRDLRFHDAACVLHVCVQSEFCKRELVPLLDQVLPPPYDCLPNNNRTPEHLAVSQPRWTDGAAFRGPDGVDVDDSRALPHFLRPLAHELLAAGRAAALLVHLEQV